jgi:hypothetical protein
MNKKIVIMTIVWFAVFACTGRKENLDDAKFFVKEAVNLF